jgi:ribosomal protein L3
MLQLASELSKLIKEKGLSSNIQGKQFVNVEGWQFAGASLGLMPIITSTQDLSNETTIKYMATCEVRNINTGQLVATGIALCTNAEKTKRFFDEYAILSMAQTRAIGKAYRNLLAWLMKAAGFEATPAEEMDFADAKADARAKEEHKKPVVQEVEVEEVPEVDRIELIKAITECTKNKELVDLYYAYKQYIDGDQALLMLFKSRKESFTVKTKK